jgi:two-component system, sensor histidine kinase
MAPTRLPGAKPAAPHAPEPPRAAWVMDATQVELLRDAPALSVALGFVHAIAIALPFVGLVPGATLAAWLLVFAAVRLGRATMSRRLRSFESDAAGLQRSSSWILVVSGLHSLVWGLGSWWLVAPANVLAETVLHVVLAAVLCGNVRHLSNGYPVLVVYTLGVAVPLVLRDLWIGGQHVALAALFTLLAVLTLFEGHRQARVLADARQQRRENALLIAALKCEVDARTAAQALAEHAHEAKARFLAAASHDLRQPLNAIGLLVQALPAQASQSQTAKVAAQAFSCVQQMGEIVDHLLELSQLQAGTVVPEKTVFDVAALLRNVAAMHQPAADRQGLNLHVHAESLWVHSDPRLLQRVLVNLVSNALRYTERGEVRLSACQRGDGVEVCVVDTGIGMNAHALEHVFEPFYQVANPARDARMGHGLGLAIVKGLSDLLHLALQVDSSPGRGSSFTLQLDGSAAASDVAHGAVAGSADALLSRPADRLTGRRVLVIEDHLPSNEALTLLLRAWGCEVWQAASAREALAQAGAGRMPEFIVADLCLPDGDDGCLATLQLRERAGEHLPAVLVTGEPGEPRAVQARQAGFVVLAKPIKPVQLRAFMNDAFALR